MIRISRLLSIFTFFILAGQVSAQSGLPIQVEMDHATFAYDDESSLVELYVSFGINQQEFEPAETGYQAGFPVEVMVFEEAGESEPAWQYSNLLRFVVPDTSNLSETGFFVHQMRMALKPGNYDLHLTIPEDAAKNRKQLELRQELLVPDFDSSNEASLSDVVLATDITTSSNHTDPFYKNGLSIRPSVTRLYGKGIENVFYYVEAYNAAQIAGSNGKYALHAFVARSNTSHPISANLETHFDRDPRSPDVIVGKFDLSELPSGSYTLNVALANEAKKTVTRQSQKFFVYNPGVEEIKSVASEATESSLFTIMTEEQIDEALEHIQIIATDSERKQARGIKDLAEKRRFLTEFWQKRNPSQDSPFNSFREEFNRRIRVADERYRGAFGPGWKTDRGRILVKYGPPVNIEQHLYDQQVKPYEIWQYDNIPGEGQAIFVFADRNGFGQFELLHSTVSGERSLVDWETELRR